MQIFHQVFIKLASVCASIKLQYLLPPVVLFLSLFQTSSYINLSSCSLLSLALDSPPLSFALLSLDDTKNNTTETKEF